ncbi:MAG: GTP diphosphokinase [Succinivibrio sp.]|nr:GTP diphosphokinase [Succinivibrio sp.]
MVAIRQTHSAGFDLTSWIESLALPPQTSAILHETYDFAVAKLEKLHFERKSGNTAIPSPAEFTKISSEIVGILVTLNMDEASLQVAILYPAFEQGAFKFEDVEENFSLPLAKLLRKVKDMEAIRFLQSLKNGRANEAQVDRVRRMLLAMVDDVRAVVIKLAERIAFIRAASQADQTTKIAIAKEISNIYGPLANRLGIGQLKWELEDLAFKFLHHDEYMEIAHDLGERRIEREQYIENFVAELKELLEKEGIEHAKVYGRPKHIYSIWRKMQRKHLPFSELYDVRAVRVMVDKIPDCYAVLGVVTARWKQIQKEFDDYIANPKPNGYQSIHTVVYGDGNKVVEIQIRTERMHNQAENGVAAHWKYKEGAGQSSGVEQRIAWLRKLLSWRDDLVESGALIDDFKQQVFEDRVYVFTPQGEVIDLPTGSTPLDFAYAVHTMIGHRCIGAKVEGRIVPFTYQLKTGDQVEIITQKNPNPSRDWLNAENGFLKTNKARNKVAAYFKKIDHDVNAAQGEEILTREVAKQGWQLSKDELVAALKEGLAKFNMKTVEDLFSVVGAGDLSSGAVVNYLRVNVPKLSEAPKELDFGDLDGKDLNFARQPEQKRNKSVIAVNGVDNLMTHLAKCCRPIPNDEIIGFITKNRGITIHRANCEQLQHLNAEDVKRLIPAQWGNAALGSFEATVQVLGAQGSGIINEVVAVLANEKINAQGIKTHYDGKHNTAIIELSLKVPNSEFLERIIKKLADLKSVASAVRI